MSAVLGVDPGTRKVGYAVTQGAQAPALEQGILPLEGLAAALRAIAQRHGVSDVALGRGTNAKALLEQLAALDLPVHLIDEADTTYRARAVYFADHPPRGWRRLVPISLQLPPRPIDDYAALLIARRYLGGGDLGQTAYVTDPAKSR